VPVGLPLSLIFSSPCAWWSSKATASRLLCGSPAARAILQQGPTTTHAFSIISAEAVTHAFSSITAEAAIHAWIVQHHVPLGLLKPPYLQTVAAVGASSVQVLLILIPLLLLPASTLRASPCFDCISATLVWL
jgi:hypothetical protein